MGYARRRFVALITFSVLPAIERRYSSFYDDDELFSRVLRSKVTRHDDERDRNERNHRDLRLVDYTLE